MADETKDENIEPGFFLDWPAWAARLLRLSSKLVRVRYVGFSDFQGEQMPAIFANWHCEDLAIFPLFGHYNFRVLVSPSKDGAILSRAVNTLGFDTSRGSSSRGALGGLLALKQSLIAGQSVVVAADGPRGPRQVAKPGPVYLAAKTGRPILALGSACSFKYVFKKTWNKSVLPLPGAKLVVCISQPLMVPPEAAKWPQYQKSRFMGLAISDVVREAELELARWLGGEKNL